MTLSRDEVWVLIVAAAVLTVAIKAVGPVLLGGRDLPASFHRVTALLAPSLLCALVITSVLATGTSWSVGAHTVGVSVAAVLLWRRHSLVLSVLVAVVITAGLRAL